MASKVDVVKLLRLAVQPPRQSIVMIDTEHQFLGHKSLEAASACGVGMRYTSTEPQWLITLAKDGVGLADLAR